MARFAAPATTESGDAVSAKELLDDLPWWVKWVGIPAIALVVFGGLLLTVLKVVIGLLFKVLVFAVLVAGLIYVARKVTASSSSGGGDRR